MELKVDGTTVAFTEKQNVERETKQRNKRHFNQPAGSPFTIYPLSQLGTNATKFKTNIFPDGMEVKILADTFLETQTILDLLQQPLPPGAHTADISSCISLSDFTTVSGRHLGHYKLLVKTLQDPNTPPDIKTAAEEILTLLVKIMDLACNKGFSLQQ
jgi:hypothetical protein